MNLPSIFEPYTITVSNTDLAIIVKTKGKVSRIDCNKLVDLGWMQINDSHFEFIKPVFEELDD